MEAQMNKKRMNRAINAVQDNKSGFAFTIFDDFFLSEKSVKLQEGGVVSFFVKKDFVNNKLVRIAIDKISEEKNCIYVHSINVKPKHKASKYRRNAFVSKIKGVTANDSKKKVYVKLKNPAAFLSKLMEVSADV
jgi:hypothetical protein